MKRRVLPILMLVLAVAAAVYLAPVFAGSQGEKVVKPSTHAAGTQAPACSTPPPGRKVAIEPPNPGEPLPGPLCYRGFCSSTDGIRCVAGQGCGQPGKCIYYAIEDGSCINPDPLPTSWCGGCT